MMFNYATNFVMIEEGVLYKIMCIYYIGLQGISKLCNWQSVRFFLHLVCTTAKLTKFNSILRATIFNIYFYFTSPQSQLAVPTSSAAPMASASPSDIPATKRRTVPMVLTSSQAVAVSISPAWPISQRYWCFSLIWILYRQCLPQPRWLYVRHPELYTTILGVWPRTRLPGWFGWIRL